MIWFLAFQWAFTSWVISLGRAGEESIVLFIFLLASVNTVLCLVVMKQQHSPVIAFFTKKIRQDNNRILPCHSRVDAFIMQHRYNTTGWM